MLLSNPDVCDIGWFYIAGKVDAPKQLVIQKDASSIPEVVKLAGLTLPLGMCLD